MSKNIEIQINTGSAYEALYPKTLGSLVDGSVSSAKMADTATTADTLSATLTISEGGTSATTASSAMYNLTYPLSTRAASSLNSYASSTYIPCYYSSTGYKFPLSNIMTYINNNVSAGAKIVSGSRTGDGATSYTIALGGRAYFCLVSIVYSSTIDAGFPTYGNTNNSYGQYRQMNGSIPLMFFYSDAYTRTEQYLTNKDIAQIVIITSTVSTSSITVTAGQNADASTIANESSSSYCYMALVK